MSYKHKNQIRSIEGARRKAIEFIKGCINPAPRTTTKKFCTHVTRKFERWGQHRRSNDDLNDTLQEIGRYITREFGTPKCKNRQVVTIKTGETPPKLILEIEHGDLIKYGKPCRLSADSSGINQTMFVSTIRPYYLLIYYKQNYAGSDNVGMDSTVTMEIFYGKRAKRITAIIDDCFVDVEEQGEKDRIDTILGIVKNHPALKSLEE